MALGKRSKKEEVTMIRPTFLFLLVLTSCGARIETNSSVCNVKSQLPPATITTLADGSVNYDGIFSMTSVAKLPDNIPLLYVRSHGGNMRAMKVLAGKAERVKVYDFCDSACAFMAVQYAKKVCLGKGVSPRFHSLGKSYHESCNRPRNISVVNTRRAIYWLKPILRKKLSKLHLTNDLIEVSYEEMAEEYPELVCH